MESSNFNCSPPEPPGKTSVPGFIDLKGLDQEGLISFCKDMGEPPYRGQQLFSWIYAKGEVCFDKMTDLPKTFREKLSHRARVGFFYPEGAVEAADGTVKYAFLLADGERVESVRISMPRGRGDTRWTLCVSTQVGCAMGCVFCLTAKMGLVRQLSPGEIIEQFLAARRSLPEGQRFHNIVFMGMGEPLDNFSATVTAALILTHPGADGVSARRLTISTVGLASKLAEFVRQVPGVGLAVSLNAADDATRGKIMPVNRKWNLDALLKVCRDLPIPERRRITFEYVLIGGINDKKEDASRLAHLLRGIQCKVNLIPWNPFSGAPFERPPLHRIEEFQQILVQSGYTATVRQSKGMDIGAACGQLVDLKRLARSSAEHKAENILTAERLPN